LERAGHTRKVGNLTGPTQLDYNLDFIIKSNAGPEPAFLSCRSATTEPLGRAQTDRLR
jgi:hypothetical protein